MIYGDTRVVGLLLKDILVFYRSNLQNIYETSKCILRLNNEVMLYKLHTNISGYICNTIECTFQNCKCISSRNYVIPFVVMLYILNKEHCLT